MDGRRALPQGCTIVVDLGKTLSKVTLWSGEGRLLDRQVRPNTPLVIEGICHLDATSIGMWLVETLGRYRDADVRTIIPVGHGAGVAVLRGDKLAFPPLDYEQEIPAEIVDAYLGERDSFEETGSPALPGGLNIGAQLYWVARRHPEVIRDATLLPWAQYWAWFLSGAAASEITSLGCHSDLWSPHASTFSPMAVRLGWASRFAPLRQASDVVGTLKPDLAAATGLPATVRVLVGLHDSNAALLAARGFAEIGDNEATVLSTGTWFVAMRLAGRADGFPALPAGRDCLVNVDPFGRPLASSRFMGGREIETIIEIDTRRVDIRPDQPALLATVPALVSAGSMLLPTLTPGCGPFPFARSRWLHRPDDWHARRAAACLYAALVADEALDLIGSRERILVEGRFAEAEVFVRALAAFRPDTAVFTANAHNDVSFGALRLVDPMLVSTGKLERVRPFDGELLAYRRRWRSAVEGAI